MQPVRWFLCLSYLVVSSQALVVPLGAQLGSVARVQRINRQEGNFAGGIQTGFYFGWSLAALGDIDGDGVGDLAVGVYSDPDGGPNRGAIWILFLNADATVRRSQKISSTEGGFFGVLVDRSRFGRQLANVGDLDGDGVNELAALSLRRVWVLFLNRDGTVRTLAENLFSDTAFVPPSTSEAFRRGGLAALGDLDGDGLGDLALGAPQDSDGAHEAGALWIMRLASDGSFLAAHKISQREGGFTGVLEEDAYFGSTIVPLGDLDGDGGRELLVSAGYFDDGVWILHLDDSERVIAQRRFDRREYGLAWPENTLASSSELASLGDLDGDGIGDLAMGWFTFDFPGGGLDEGGMAIGFLDGEGGVRKRLRISSNRGGLGPIERSSLFGSSFAPLGDLDRDGTLELAVGVPLDLAAGGVWILSLQPSAQRNGSGVNPLTLAQDADPVFGTTWRPRLDCSAHVGGSAVLLGAASPSAGLMTPFGESLVSGQRLFFVRVVHARNPAAFSLRIPPARIDLIDLPVFTQGLCTGQPHPQLSNALDVLVGR